MSIRDTIRKTSFYQKLGTRISIFKGRMYDRKHGVHTAPEVYLDDLTIDSPNVKLGGNYSGTEPNYFRQILNDLTIDFERFTFIDFGSGMGRALFLASEHPFKRIIGVEFSSELHEIAARNIENFSSTDQKCSNVESICEDAAKFEIPDGPLVCYFFNPFEREIFELVIQNIERSLTEDPREIYVLYANPQHNQLFEENPAFEQIDSGPWHTLHSVAAAANGKFSWAFAAFGVLQHSVH